MSHGREMALNDKMQRLEPLALTSSNHQKLKMQEALQLQSKDSLQNQVQGDPSVLDDSLFHTHQSDQTGETPRERMSKDHVPIKEMRLVSLDKGGQLFTKERRSLPTAKKAG